MKMSFLERIAVNSRLFDFWRIISMKRLLKEVRATKGLVFEIGCGKGTTTLQIAQKIKDAKMIATDYDPIEVKYAKARVKKSIYAGRILVRRADATALAQNDTSVSAFFSLLTLHHIRGWERAVSEAHRVLKKGGHWYIDELVLKPFPLLQHFFFPAEGIFSKRELLGRLRANGFEIVHESGLYHIVIVAKKS